MQESPLISSSRERQAGCSGWARLWDVAIDFWVLHTVAEQGIEVCCCSTRPPNVQVLHVMSLQGLPLQATITGQAGTKRPGYKVKIK